jgi:heme-degrading monooxygenase HmoA
MCFVSVTRLRVRSARFMPFFALHTLGSLKQVKRAQGFRGGSLLPDRRWTFWTMTAWDSHDNMRQFMLNGPHRAAMPHLLDWCDEASVVHWEQPEDALPSWEEADKRMRESGRASKVRFPSPQHASLTYAAPRLTRAAPIQPVTAPAG